MLSYYKKFDRIWKEEGGTVLFSPQELFMIYSVARAQRDHGGVFAEVGVFRGASAKVIATAKRPETKLFLFDTFEGLPDVGDLDPRFEAGMFRADQEDVRQRLSRYPNIELVKGLFPDSGRPINNRRISFVHLDVDTYESTRASLRFFQFRMSPGGIILSHDYSQCEGVKRAFDEFMEDADQYRLIELSVSQVMIIRN
jgi:hypothetical protein